MANFINIYSDLAAYNADETKEYPNVSYLETEDEVKWQATEPIDQEYVVAKYNVVDTTNPTKILNRTNNITSMEVDGVQQPVGIYFTFSTTGTHTVKYKVNSSWDGNRSFGGSIGASEAVTSVTIPDSVTSIGYEAFRDTGLVKVHIPTGTTSIGEGAFRRCFSLTSKITIPSSVTSIANAAFNASRNIASITVEATTPPTLGGAVFEGTFPIYVPSASVNAYKTAANWSTYASRIQAIQ